MLIETEGAISYVYLKQNGIKVWNAIPDST